MKINWIKRTVAVLTASSLLFLMGCGVSEETPEAETEQEVQKIATEEEAVPASANESHVNEDGSITIVDQLGKTIEFESSPERVATTIMPFPYIFYAVVGNNDNLVGCNPSSIVAYEDSALKYMYPELANAETDFVDTSFVVNVEEVIKLKPDVVFQWNYMTDEITKMEEAGIKVIALEYGTIDDLETWIKIISVLMNKEERGEELISYFYDSVNEVDERLADLSEDEYTNVLLMNDDMKVTGQGFTYYLMEHSGAINPAQDLSGEALNVNMEQIYEWNPSIVYVGNFTDLQPSDILENKLEGEDWSVVEAVQNNQVYKIPIGGYRWDPPGIETPLMIKWLAKIQHPDLFEDMDMYEEVRAFYKDVYNFDITDEMLDEILGDTQN